MNQFYDWMFDMKIGYPCINNSIGCTANSTFRLSSYSEQLLKEKIKNNLDCLLKILKYNKNKGILFFRISSDIIPFASHPICIFEWQKYFNKEFSDLGEYITKNNMRISMHPDQFVLLNSPKPEVVERSIAELEYHCEVLDLMGLDNTAKVQIHIGGAYGDKKIAVERFVMNYDRLPKQIKKRLVIENDDRIYTLADCMQTSKITGIPVLFDFFHHACLSNGERISDAVKTASKTWKKDDGILMTDYSSQEPKKRKGTHAKRIDLKDFSRVLSESKETDFDIMLEIKDKEKSAIRAIAFLQKK